MKKLWRLGVLFATMCSVGFFISSWSGAAEQAAAKPEPKVKSVTRENIHGVMAPDDKNIWLVGNYGVIFHSSDAGETWNPQKSGVYLVRKKIEIYQFSSIKNMTRDLRMELGYFCLIHSMKCQGINI